MEENFKLMKLEKQILSLQDQIVDLQNVVGEQKAEISELRDEIETFKEQLPNYEKIVKERKHAAKIWKRRTGNILLEQFSEIYNRYRKTNENDNPFIDPLDIVYATMGKSFGFTKSNVIKIFESQGVGSDNVYNIVAYEPLYQMYFVQAINKLVNVYSQKLGDCSQGSCDDEIKDLVDNDSVFVQVLNDEITQDTDVDEAIEIVARYLNDINPKRQKTLNAIYECMFFPEQWREEFENIKSMGIKCSAKKDSFRVSEKCKEKFLDACANIVSDQKAIMFNKIVV